MNTPIRPLNDVRRTLDIDLVADFTCPWSWLGMAQLTRALGSLSGDVETRLRWHPFRMASPNANTAPRSFHDYLAERLPQGISVPFAEKSLAEAGRELGLDFHFEKLGSAAEHLRGASAGSACFPGRAAGECSRGNFPRVFRTRGRHRRRRRAGADRCRSRARSENAAGVPRYPRRRNRPCWQRRAFARLRRAHRAQSAVWRSRAGAGNRERRHVRACARPGAVSRER